MVQYSLPPALPLVIVIAMAGCAARGDDPYEPLNRRVHAFNTGVDAQIVRPLTRPLRSAASGPTNGEPGVLDTVALVGDNLSLPGQVINHVLQGRPVPAARNTLRFAVNTTLGLGGLMDPAGREFGLAEVDTDFGETLHVWGVSEGAYLELPLLGPSTERDAVGKVVDIIIDPVGNWLDGDAKTAARVVKVVSKAGDRARLGDTVDSVLHGSADSYTQTKLLYQQHRRFELGQEAEVIDPYSE